MKHTLSLLVLLMLIVVVAAMLRLPQLDTRPMHADEAVQAARFRDLWQQGHYVYDPDEFHGPTLPYATLASPTLFGAEDFASTTPAMYRLVPAIFGMGIVLLYFLFRSTLGLAAVAIAAMLAALSPAMVFYSRYYIHESLLACFTLAAIAFGWRYVTSGKLAWCLPTGISIGLMQATKETAAIAYLAALAATGCVWLGNRRQQHALSDSYVYSWKHLAVAGVAAIFVAVTLLSSFYANWHGSLDGLVYTYLPWLMRAGGASPHVHPWSFYLHRLLWWRTSGGPLWSEGLVVVLAGVALVRAVAVKRPAVGVEQLKLMRWLAAYSVAMIVIYSAIPYKTPWCLLQFHSSLLLLAGVGASSLLTLSPHIYVRVIIAVLLTVGGGHLGRQAYRANFVFPADPENPYNYAQTSPDVSRLAEQLEGLAVTHENAWELSVKVIWTDAYYWPLPWYLRRFENTELWRSMPPDPAAPIVIAAPQFDRALTTKLGPDYIMTDHYELRPQVLLQLWVQYDLWEAYLRRIGRID